MIILNEAKKKNEKNILLKPSVMPNPIDEDDVLLLFFLFEEMVDEFVKALNLCIISHSSSCEWKSLSWHLGEQ